MSTITPTSVITGLSATHRSYMAQLRDVVVITNGFDANQQVSIRGASGGVLGIAPPVAAPTGAALGTAGTFLYRVRWWDSVAGAISNASPIFTATELDTITRPGSPPARVTHWILERTTNGGSTYYPVNQTFSAPNGTAIGTTTFADSVTDATLSARISYPDNHGSPGPYRYCFVNGPRVFLCCADAHTPTVTVTNGSATVSASTNQFIPSGYTNTTTPLLGQFFYVPGDTDGVRYTITAVAADGKSCTLSANYTSGSTRTIACSIIGRRDRVAWSEAGYPESYGSQAVGLLSNELILGDDGAAIVSGCGIGSEGVVWAKEQGLLLHVYFIDPDPVAGDGRISVIPTRRGALGPKCLRFIDGVVYGMDYRGIWAMPIGSQPDEIGGPLSAEWINNNINFTKGDNFHIGYDPFNRWAYFFVCEGSDTYPKKAYVYDLDSKTWIMSQTYPLGVTATCERTDTNGIVRMCYFQETATGSGGSANSFEYMASIGNTLGADPTNTPLFGTASTNGGNSTITDSTATWTGTSLSGCAVTKIAAASGVAETHIIASNTSTAITICDTWTTNPLTGDSYYIAPIPSSIRTGRLFFGTIERKKIFYSLWVWMTNKTPCTKLRCRIYKNGATTPDSDQVLTIVEDGVSKTAGTSEITIDPTATTTTTAVAVRRFKVELNKMTADDIQIELYSYEAAAPYEILGMKVKADVEPNNIMPGEA